MRDRLFSHAIESMGVPRHLLTTNMGPVVMPNNAILIDRVDDRPSEVVEDDSDDES